MILLFPLIAFLAGMALAFKVVPPISGLASIYIAVGCLAGMDTVFGGIRSGLEGKYHNDVFVTGFISNILIASFFAWLGDRIYINLYLAVALVLGQRIFTNLSLIRRYLLTKWQDARERERLQLLAQKQAALTASETTQ